MGLVSYSDSEESGSEQSPAPKPKANTSKAKFEKIVDRSNPGKIRVNLPGVAQDDGKDNDAQVDGPPAKRARLGGSSFNSFLPAPKRSGPAITASNGSGPKRGLGSGVSLKTGATPGFSREPVPESEEYDESTIGADLDSGATTGDLQQTSSFPGISVPEQKDDSPILPDFQPARKPMMFKPLSVTAKKKKKKAAPPATQPEPTLSTDQITSSSKPPAKISLFSMGGDNDSNLPVSSAEEYKPIVYETAAETRTESESPTALTEPVYQPEETPQNYPPVPVAQGDQSLNVIAADLNLSESAKRQLFGRRHGSKDQVSMPSAINIINFNMDQEYAANEEARQAGETVVQNAVRSVAPGKHSLKQLVNAASGQKEALEESFASGRRNKSEAGSKYGW